MSEKYINLSIKFTETYKKYIDASPEIREIMCLKTLYPYGLKNIKEDSVFAGMQNMDGMSGFNNLPVVFNPKKESQIAYFASISTLRYYAKEFPERAKEIEEVIEFWKKEATFIKIREEAPQDVKDYLFPNMMGLDDEGYMRKTKPGKPRGSGFISGSFDTRIAGIMPDFRVILENGIPGLYALVEKYENINGKNDFYTSVRLGLELATDTMEYYRNQLEEIIPKAKQENKKRLIELDEILFNLQRQKPQTLKEAMQLMAIFIVLTGIDNFGRMDVFLGDYLASDIDSGLLTEEDAIELIIAFWDFLSDNSGAYDSRVIIGGKGRENEENADKFAMLALEATRRRHQVKPVLTLRLYKEQNPMLYKKGLELISEGCIYPTLYNDEVSVEGFMKSMDVPYEDALDYTPIGCGEMVIAGKSVGSPNSTFRMLKGLEAALHNGYDGISGAKVGISTGEIEEFDTFDKLLNAFLKQLDARLQIDAKVHAWNRKITAREAAFVLPSLFMSDCLEKGKAIFQGGVRYFGANLEGFGLTNVVNSLAVIKKLVYEENKYTLSEIVNILDNNFEGYEEEKELFKSIDKFGNNKPWVDDLKLPIEKFINEKANEYGKQNGFHYCTIASVNPGGITIGPSTGASADGRNKCQDFALANSPMPGTDISGITAMLLSTAKADAANGGYVTNMNISRETMLKNIDKVGDIFKTYFEIGGLQLNINCFSRGDLEKALINPEEYRNIIVRVSGYSARFVELDPITQKHIMERTLY